MGGVITRDGHPCRFAPLVGAFNQTNITVTGGGTIDGQVPTPPMGYCDEAFYLSNPSCNLSTCAALLYRSLSICRIDRLIEQRCSSVVHHQLASVPAASLPTALPAGSRAASASASASPAAALAILSCPALTRRYVGGWRRCEHGVFLIDTATVCGSPTCDAFPLETVYLKATFGYEDAQAASRALEPTACCDVTNSHTPSDLSGGGRRLP